MFYQEQLSLKPHEQTLQDKNDLPIRDLVLQ